MKTTESKNPDCCNSQGLESNLNQSKELNSMNTLALNYQDFIIANDNEVKTSSLKVAEAFGKLHKNVIQKIENLDCSPEFRLANFSANVQNQIVGTSTRDIPYYEMTKDGFMFLVMGFTGKAAAQVKEAYINAFNWMAAQLFDKHKQPQITTSAISDEQAGILFNIVATRTGKNGKLRAEMWGRLKNHFKYASYLKLKAIHFEEAKLILETMELHGEVKALPAPQQESYFLNPNVAKEFDARLHSLFDLAGLMASRGDDIAAVFQRQAKALNKLMAQ